MRQLQVWFLMVAGTLLAGAAGADRPRLELVAPAAGQLSQVGPVALELELPPGAKARDVVVEVDGAAVDASDFDRHGRTLTGTLEGLGAGRHTLAVSVAGKRGKHGDDSLSSWFELVELENPDSCEVLNQASCLLPFPSSRFLERAHTRTGYRVAYPPDALPVYGRFDVPTSFPPAVVEEKPIDPAPFLRNDGFSPTVQVLMHFPGGVDPLASDAPRIDRATRTYGTRGLDDDSPTLLFDRRSGERINHFIENDSTTTDLARRVTFLRPGESLLPGHRYVVAVRNLVGPTGAPVEAEPVFAAIRDGRPSDIPAVEATRRRVEPLLRWLARQGVAREELVLAFDFVISSDHSLTYEMLSMRDQAFRWLAEQVEAGVQTFTVDEVRPVNESCDPAGSPVWREVRGSFQAPLFLSSDPFAAAKDLGFLQRNERGRPVWHTLTAAPYGIAIPCSARLDPRPALVIGHGLFGTGPDAVSQITQAEGLEGFDFVAGGTNWSGLSSPDISPNVLDSFIIRVIADVDRFEALPDRLRQGQLHALLLARMLKQGVFHLDPAFRVEGRGVIDVEAPAVYFGVSLGGIMGTMFAALTPDVEKLNVDVPAINFSLLLQRAKPFKSFELLVSFVNADPMEQAIGYGLNQELWVRGEPSGYANHVTGAPLRPLRGSPPKQMLVTVAWLDQQVSNLGSQLLGRTLRLGTLEGSFQRGLAGMPDTTGPQDSGYVVYDTGSYDVDNPAHRPFIPPLGNRPPLVDDNRCDPHPIRGLIPASIDQLRGFLEEGGRIENFCADGRCDASEPNEIPFGAAEPCDPLE
jgi:pimeloyl-ACP methyl ester carboxylesterase